MKVIIAGAGIGGLTTALTLHAAGHDVAVFEATSQIRPLGVGINLLPHAAAILDELGLIETLLAQGVATAEFDLSDAVTSFQVSADAYTSEGAIGGGGERDVFEERIGDEAGKR